MKRIIALLLLAALLLTGCALTDSDGNTVTFYYLRGEIQYGSAEGVIAPEARELTSPSRDLSYLMNLYLRGPVDETLQLPLPTGTRLTDLQARGNTVTLTFSPELNSLEGMELSIACACISFTCFSLTDAETVTILAPTADRDTGIRLTFTRDSFLTYDDTTKAADAS